MLNLTVRYDVFISYAVEDRAVVEAIEKYLTGKGLRVFYLGQNLEVGDSIAAEIYLGIRRSRYVIMILSHHYKRFWTSSEAGAFREREYRKKVNRIFPVWHNITHDQVKQDFPWLEDRFSVCTEEGLQVVNEKLYRAIIKRKRGDRRRLLAKSGLFSLGAGVLFLLFAHVIPSPGSQDQLPDTEAINAAVIKRVSDTELAWEQIMHEACKMRPVALDSIIRMYNLFTNMSEEGMERNLHRFTSGYQDVNSKRGILKLGIPLFTTPHKAFGIENYSAFQIIDTCTARVPSFSYCYLISNKDTLLPAIDTIISLGPGEALVRVSYRNFIRHVRENLVFIEPMERREQLIMAFKPIEEYLFELRKGKWEFVKLN